MSNSTSPYAKHHKITFISSTRFFRATVVLISHARVVFSWLSASAGFNNDKIDISSLNLSSKQFSDGLFAPAILSAASHSNKVEIKFRILELTRSSGDPLMPVAVWSFMHWKTRVNTRAHVKNPKHYGHTKIQVNLVGQTVAAQEAGELKTLTLCNSSATHPPQPHLQTTTTKTTDYLHRQRYAAEEETLEEMVSNLILLSAPSVL